MSAENEGIGTGQKTRLDRYGTWVALATYKKRVDYSVRNVMSAIVIYT